MGMQKKDDSNVATGVTYGVVSSSSSSNSIHDLETDIMKDKCFQWCHLMVLLHLRVHISNSICYPETGITKERCFQWCH